MPASRSSLSTSKTDGEGGHLRLIRRGSGLPSAGKIEFNYAALSGPPVVLPPTAASVIPPAFVESDEAQVKNAI